MNDNLDDWLSSLGIEPNDTPATLLESSPVQVVTAPRIEETQSLSDEDFDDILEDFGFTPPEDTEAEEIHDESDNTDWNEDEEEPVDPTVDDDVDSQIQERMQNLVSNGIISQATADQAIRDLDAEEDADWQEAIDSGRITPIELPADMDRLRAAATGITQQEAVHENLSEEPLLPLNSPTLLLDESTTRFSGAEWYNEIQKQSIIVGGVGGIGSNLVFQLSRMHPRSIFMYDDDSVEVVNMAGQLYARNDVGKSKVSAMSDMITAYTNMQGVYALQQKFTANTEAGNVMMCGFDNMEARRTFFNAWQRHVFALPKEEWYKCLFLDGRLSIDTLQILCVTGDNAYAMTEYRDSYLFSDSEADHTVCSMKQTTYLACMIASLMTNLFTNWVAGLLDPVIPYDLPFFTEYDAQNMIFKTIK